MLSCVNVNKWFDSVNKFFLVYVSCFQAIEKGVWKKGSEFSAKVIVNCISVGLAFAASQLIISISLAFTACQLIIGVSLAFTACQLIISVSLVLTAC